MGEPLKPPSPYWVSDEGDVTLYLGKCEKVLPDLPANSVDAIVTDPPAAIAFMGRSWDSDLGGRDKWVGWLSGCMEAAARVLKPGGHLLVWSLPRTSHWTAWALEDAGLEIRDCIVHLFGSGFPKSLDVSKAIDKAAGAQREVVGPSPIHSRGVNTAFPKRPGENTVEESGRLTAQDQPMLTAPATEDAARWEGWGTALKPGQEMWWLARKPLAAGTVAANVLQFGTGALNIDGCRVEGVKDTPASPRRAPQGPAYGDLGNDPGTGSGWDPNIGRWPANIVFTHSASCEMTGTRRVKGGNRPSQQETPREAGDWGFSGRAIQDYAAADGLEVVESWSCADDCPVAELDRQSGASTSRIGQPRQSAKPGHGYGMTHTGAEYADQGGASRFYPTFKYQAKAPASERPRLEDGAAHETVKPLGLISWLVRLITPPGGTVLDMFAGSGPVAEACIIEGFRCVLIEQDPKSAELIKTRLSKPIQPTLFGLEAS